MQLNTKNENPYCQFILKWSYELAKVWVLHGQMTQTVGARMEYQLETSILNKSQEYSTVSQPMSIFPQSRKLVINYLTIKINIKIFINNDVIILLELGGKYFQNLFK